MERQKGNEFIGFLKSVGELRLAAFQRGENLTEEGRQETFNEIREILSAVCLSPGAEVTLSVPSERLIELGLVSETVAGEIKVRKTRKQEKSVVIELSDEPKNLIRVRQEKKDACFLIGKTFMVEEQSYGDENDEEAVRRDKIIEEKIALVLNGEGKWDFFMEEREGDDHLHAFGATWVRSEGIQKMKDKPWLQKEASSRDIIRTLILLIEGISPGCLSVPLEKQV